MSKAKIVTAECKFCGKTRKLCKSHIIPEWAYRPLYDERSRATEISSEDRRRRTVQSGPWQHLLCEDCETLFNERFDQPFHKFWTYPERFPKRLPHALSFFPAIEIHGIDFELTKNFLLSILWRAHVAKHEAFSAVTLGSDAERIRRILEGELHATDNEYPIYCYALRDPETGGLAEELVITPTSNLNDAQWNYHMSFLGCYWTVYGSPPQNLRSSCLLKPEGLILMPVIDYSTVFTIRSMLS